MILNSHTGRFLLRRKERDPKNRQTSASSYCNWDYLLSASRHLLQIVDWQTMSEAKVLLPWRMPCLPKSILQASHSNPSACRCYRACVTVIVLVSVVVQRNVYRCFFGTPSPLLLSWWWSLGCCFTYCAPMRRDFFTSSLREDWRQQQPEVQSSHNCFYEEHAAWPEESFLISILPLAAGLRLLLRFGVWYFWCTERHLIGRSWRHRKQESSPQSEPSFHLFNSFFPQSSC